MNSTADVFCNGKRPKKQPRCFPITAGNAPRIPLLDQVPKHHIGVPTRIYSHAGTCQLVQVGSSCRANVSLSSKALLSISKGKGWSTVVILFSVCARGEIATHIYSMCASRSLGSNLILLLSQSSPESFSCLWTPIATTKQCFRQHLPIGHH